MSRIELDSNPVGGIPANQHYNQQASEKWVTVELFVG